MLVKKFHRRLKLDFLKKHFSNLKFIYISERDVFEVYYQGKLIHAVFANRNVQDIIHEIRDKRDKIIWGR